MNLVIKLCQRRRSSDDKTNTLQVLMTPLVSNQHVTGTSQALCAFFYVCHVASRSQISTDYGKTHRLEMIIA